MSPQGRSHNRLQRNGNLGPQIASESDEAAMIDLRNEELISLAQATKRVPPARQGKTTHLSTVLRWILQGARAPNGSRVKLEAVRLGARWMTSEQALERFALRLTPSPDQAQGNGERPRSPANRKRASERAARLLDEIGI
jgi:hypothetical protein